MIGVLERAKKPLKETIDHTMLRPGKPHSGAEAQNSVMKHVAASSIPVLMQNTPETGNRCKSQQQRPWSMLGTYKVSRNPETVSDDCLAQGCLANPEP